MAGTTLLLTIFHALFRVGMAICPLFGYVHQIYLMHTLQSTEAFDNFTSLVLLNSSIARVYFWISKRFDVALLAQSALCIVAQHVILWYCAKYPKQRPMGLCRRAAADADDDGSDSVQADNPTGGEIGDGEILNHGSIRDGFFSYFRSFWNWRDFVSYLVYTISLSFVLGICTVFLVKQPVYFEALGMVSLLWDANIALPQLIRSWALRDVRGLSAIMISLWLLGKIFKFIYFGYFGAPIQFFIGNGVQTMVEGSLCVTYCILAQRSRGGSEDGDEETLMESNSSSSSLDKLPETPTAELTNEISGLVSTDAEKEEEQEVVI